MKQRTVKKAMAILLVLAMLIPFAMPTVGAADADGLLEVTAPVKVVRGDTITVTADLRQNPGVVAMQFDLEYDTASLELVEVRNGAVFTDDEFVSGQTLDAVPYTVQWLDSSVYSGAAQNNTQTGTLVTFVFYVRAHATVCKTEICLTYDADNVFGSDWQNVLFTVQNASFNVVPPRGDVNGDNSVDLKDVTILRRYLARWNVTVDPEQADVDYDGKITLKDAAELLRILTGADDEYGCIDYPEPDFDINFGPNN